MSRFNALPPTELDPIMKANAEWPAFRAEHPDAINTTIGKLVTPEYEGAWQPETVQKARLTALQAEIEARSFDYQSPQGHMGFLVEAGKLVFSEELFRQSGEDLIGYQSSGGTGVLRLASEAVKAIVAPEKYSQKVPLVYDAGWPNHEKIFEQGFRFESYQHLTPEIRYNHTEAVLAYEQAPQYSVFLLQACGYNNDGADRTYEQWDDILDIAEEKEAVVLFDTAYLGLANGFAVDNYPIRRSTERGLFTVVAFSASKNLGLYSERVGAMYVANAQAHLHTEQFKIFNTTIANIVRRTDSSAPKTSAAGAALAIQQGNLFKEINKTRMRLLSNRLNFAEILQEERPAIAEGRGLFTRIFREGFSQGQIDHLNAAGIHVLPNSRINLGGLQPNQVIRVGEAVLDSLKIA